MIITNVNSKDLKSFQSVHPRFKKAFEFIEMAVKEDLADGNYEIDGKDIYAFISSYKTKTEREAKFEAHKKYIDIQCILSGTEVIGFETPEKVELIEDYKDGGDICFYSLNKDYDKIVLTKGEFAIIMTDELHAPCLSLNDEPTDVKKVVVKICY
jgi:YhcH/YjgK/YiaL family protein